MANYSLWRMKLASSDDEQATVLDQYHHAFGSHADWQIIKRLCQTYPPTLVLEAIIRCHERLDPATAVQRVLRNDEADQRFIPASTKDDWESTQDWLFENVAVEARTCSELPPVDLLKDIEDIGPPDRPQVQQEFVEYMTMTLALQREHTFALARMNQEHPGLLEAGLAGCARPPDVQEVGGSTV